MEELHASVKGLIATSEILDAFVSRYGEFVSLRRPRAERSSRATTAGPPRAD